MKNPFWRGIIGIIFAIALVVLGMVHLNRWNIALSSIGFSPSATGTVYEGVDANGDHYRVVACAGTGEYEHLALLTENRFGWWKATQVSHPVGQDELGRIAWSNVAGLRCADPGGKVKVDFEFHAVYCGDNAIGPVSPITAKLPPNVTVDIYQSGSSYLLHFIFFGQDSPLNGLSVEELLRSVGAVL